MKVVIYIDLQALLLGVIGEPIRDNFIVWYVTSATPHTIKFQRQYFYCLMLKLIYGDGSMSYLMRRHTLESSVEPQ